MRIVNLMTLVCLLIVLAIIPACVNFANACGLQSSATLTTATALVLLAGAASRRF